MDSYTQRYRGQVKLTPEQGGRFHEPVGPDAATVALIRAADDCRPKTSTKFVWKDDFVRGPGEYALLAISPTQGDWWWAWPNGPVIAPLNCQGKEPTRELAMAAAEAAFLRESK